MALSDVDADTIVDISLCMAVVSAFWARNDSFHQDPEICTMWGCTWSDIACRNYNLFPKLFSFTALEFMQNYEFDFN